jgi:hypothetical protein
MVQAEELGVATYVRTDTDRTLVIAPRLRVQTNLTEETRATAVYAVDVWTSASIDIMSSASTTPVTEQRDELNLSIDHELADVTITGAYRYSVEPDYVSHGGSGGIGYDFADNNSQLGIGISGSSDKVGRAGDPHFAERVATLGARLSFTQVLDRDTIAQAQYELSRAEGFLASTYRYVAIGGADCTTAAPLCVPEHVPGERLRHAVSIFAKRSFGDSVSLGAGYRFYLDDWGLLAHTLRAEVGLMPGPDTVLRGRYRFYMQGPTDHYQAAYAVPQPYVTSDKEQSPLSSHRLGLELEHHFTLKGGELFWTISVAPIYYGYTDFPKLESITALELNGALRVVL